MLPLLPPEKKGVSLSTVMAPEVSSTDDEAKEDNPALMAAAEDLIKAVHSKDAKAVATALESAFMECDNDDSGEAKEGPEAMCGGGMAGMLGK